MASDWNKSKAHLLFLSKLRHPFDQAHIEYLSYWDEKLGENRFDVLSRFEAEKMVVETPVTEALDCKLKVTDLKDRLRAMGLKLSGKKAELICRFAESDPVGASRMASQWGLKQCSEQGRKLANDFLEEAERFRLKMENAVIDELKLGRFIRACEIVAHYESQQVFSRGMGIDWGNYNCSRDVELLGQIMQGSPGILREQKAEIIDALRIPAALAQLFGTGITDRWIPSGIDPKSKFSPKTIVSILLNYAHFKMEISRYREAHMDFIVGVNIVSSGDLICEECNKILGEYSVENMPELPNPDCISDDWCRCFMHPIFRHERQSSRF